VIRPDFIWTGNPKLDIVNCDGIDAVALFAAATRLCKPRGISAAKQVCVHDVLSTLRTAFQLPELEDDRIYWRLRAWERRHQSYPLLKSWRDLDPLGVVLDQRYWERDLRTFASSASSSNPLYVFKMDLDRFKMINDTLGHSGGDEAIRLYCELVRDTIGSRGEVYRRGGDEVVALVFGLSDVEARNLAESVRKRIETTFQDWSKARGLVICPTASIGAVVSTGDKSVEVLCEQMDAAQRKAKDEGRNRVVFCGAMAVDESSHVKQL
jgi:diguanylate cyclase (GGDEF)-like protein